MTVLIFAALAFIATYAGGMFALRFRDKLHLILGFSAGAVIAVAFFDLLPEALKVGSALSPNTILTMCAIGFACFMIADRFFSLHSHGEQDCHNERHAHTAKGRLGAGSLSLHSFLDGFAIGISFSVSFQVGLVVALAVLAHDFSDGINTVSFIFKNGGSRKSATKWLLLDALAPVVGVIVSMFFTFSDQSLALILALFSGFFLYLGASDLLPESHHAHPTMWTTVMTVFGMAFLYGVIHFALG